MMYQFFFLYIQLDIKNVYQLIYVYMNFFLKTFLWNEKKNKKNKKNIFGKILFKDGIVYIDIKVISKVYIKSDIKK